jgi:hypothetical protein
VFLAARGTREIDGGEEKIEDEGLVAKLRRRAKGIWLRSLLLAALFTLVALLLPA